MTETYKGTCDCGQTTWEAKLEKDQQSHVLCHCNVCKKMSGGAYTLNQIIPKSALTYTNDANLKKYTYKGLSGNDVDCFYCGNCTSNSHHHQKVLGDKIVLRTALLEGAEDWPVVAEIFCKDMYKWENKTASTTFQGPPE